MSLFLDTIISPLTFESGKIAFVTITQSVYFGRPVRTGIDLPTSCTDRHVTQQYLLLEPPD